MERNWCYRVGTKEEEQINKIMNLVQQQRKDLEESFGWGTCIAKGKRVDDSPF